MKNYLIVSEGAVWDMADDTGTAPPGEYGQDWCIVGCNDMRWAQYAARLFMAEYDLRAEGFNVFGEEFAMELFAGRAGTPCVSEAFEAGAR